MLTPIHAHHDRCVYTFSKYFAFRRSFNVFGAPRNFPPQFTLFSSRPYHLPICHLLPLLFILSVPDFAYVRRKRMLIYCALPFLTAPFPFAFSAFSALNFLISFSTATLILYCNSGLYPKTLNRNSIKTKNGAKTRAWRRLSRSAGARPS